MTLMKIFFWSWSPPSRSIFFKKSSFPRTRAWSGREATVTPLKLVFTAYCCYILFCYFQYSDVSDMSYSFLQEHSMEKWANREPTAKSAFSHMFSFSFFPVTKNRMLSTIKGWGCGEPSVTPLQLVLTPPSFLSWLGTQFPLSLKYFIFLL